MSASGSQVSIVGNRVFVGSRNGVMYSLDGRQVASCGRSKPMRVRDRRRWSCGHRANATTVYFGDAHAQVYALDAATGALKWKVKVEDHLDAMITGGVVVHDDRLYVPVSSLEEGTAVLPTYECCTFRGSIVALDAGRVSRSGRRTPSRALRSPPGRTARDTAARPVGSGGVVGTGARRGTQPALHHDGRQLLGPAAPESDSIMALALDTGRVLWMRQALQSDAWNTACLGATPRRK